MTARLRRLRADDSGFALVVVMGLMMVLTLLVMTAVASATSGVRTSRSGQQYHSAQDAAQAGIQDFIYNLNRKDDYYADYVNPAAGVFTNLSGTIPGARGSYRIERVSTPEQVQATGQLLLRATGRARGPGSEERTVTVALGKASFLDYLYFTKFETVPPITAPDPVFAAANCAGTFDQRAAACTRLSFLTQDGLSGPVHSKDRIVMNGSPVFGGAFTTDWVGAGTPLRLWVEGSTGTASNPQFAVTPRSVVVPFPNTNAKLEAQARSGSGCRYFGPTRMLFNATGTVTVTSPYSGNRGSTCGNFVSPSFTVTIPVPTDGLLYVEDGVADCDSSRMSAVRFPHELDNGLLSTSKLGYSCAQGDVFVEGTVRDRVTLAARNNVVVTGNLVYAPGTSAILGLVAGSVVAVYHPVVCDASFNGTLRGLSVTNGRSAAGRCETGTNVGSPTPTTAETASTTAARRPTSYPWTNARIDAIILATENGFLVQNHLVGAPLGTLTVRGAIAQAYRGPVVRFQTETNGTITTLGGYDKVYSYDRRASYAPPPYLASLADSAWVIKEFGEQTG